jgi:hypothetical protein
METGKTYQTVRSVIEQDWKERKRLAIEMLMQRTQEAVEEVRQKRQHLIH